MCAGRGAARLEPTARAARRGSGAGGRATEPMRRFLPPQLATSSRRRHRLVKSHRREVTEQLSDLRGLKPLAERSEPEDGWRCSRAARASGRSFAGAARSRVPGRRHDGVVRTIRSGAARRGAIDARIANAGARSRLSDRPATSRARPSAGTSESRRPRTGGQARLRGALRVRGHGDRHQSRRAPVRARRAGRCGSPSASSTCWTAARGDSRRRLEFKIHQQPVRGLPASSRPCLTECCLSDLAKNAAWNPYVLSPAWRSADTRTSA